MDTSSDGRRYVEFFYKAGVLGCFLELFICLLTVLCLETQSAAADARLVTVGIYENAPKVFTSESGNPSGIFVDVIEQIARSEGWNLHYVPGTWAEGLDRLAKGEIDLMTDAAYTADREKLYSFHKVPVLTVWSQVYAPRGSGIQSILDLDGKRITALEQTIQLETFKRLANSFGLKITLIPVADYKTGFEMVVKGKADAGVTNRFYGLMHARKSGLEDTPVMFDPTPFFFAAPKGDPKRLLDAIDRRLSELKEDPQSAYYMSLKHWTSEEVQFKLPPRLKLLVLVLGLVFLVSLGGGLVLRHQVHARTRELRQMNAELRSAEERYRHLFERNPAPMLIYQRGTLKILAVNQAFAEHYGYAYEQATSLRLTDLYPEEERESIAELAARLKGHAYVGEWHHLKADGSIISIVVKSHDIDYLGYDARIAVISDISDRKEAEIRLQESERKYRELVENANSIILRWGRDGKITFINEFGQKFFGYSEEEILGRHVVGTIVPETESTGRDLSPLMDQICANPRDFEQNVNENIRRNGNRVWISWTNKPVLDEVGHVLEIFSVGSDITERVKAERELEKYREHLEEMVRERTAELEQANIKLRDLDRLKSMFIASMSHELRTPLNSIIGFTGITLQGLSGELSDEQKDNLSRVYQSAKHLLALITDVIDISKIEAGRIDVFPQAFPLKEIIADVIGTVKPQLTEKGLDLAVEVPVDVALNTDRKRLLQCLLNFMSNAVKFTEAGTITVAAGEKDGHVEISVTDTGIGIAEKDLPKLFEAFERLETHLRVKAGGTGLGLYLTRKIAMDILHGEVSVKSTEGKGSTFTLRVPKDLERLDNSERS